MDQIELEGTVPEGLGGWLLVLLLAIWLNSAAMLASGISSLAATFHLARSAAFPAQMSPVTASIAIAAGLFGAVTGYLLARKNPIAPSTARILLALTAGYYLLALLTVVFHTGPVPADFLPPWLRPGAYLIASVLGLGYLLRSRRVVRTYSPHTSEPNPSEMFHLDADSDFLRNRIFRWEELRSGESPATEDRQPLASDMLARNDELPSHEAEAEKETTKSEAPESAIEEAASHNLLDAEEPNPEPDIVQEPSTPEMDSPLPPLQWKRADPDPRELAALKAEIAGGVARWLASRNHTVGGSNAGAAITGASNGSSDLEGIDQKLLDQVSMICDQAWSVHIGESPTLPNTAESEGSLPKEIQKWAIAQAVFRLTRSLDIRAAMEVYGPFEKVVEDREYLMALGQKNSSEDAFGRKVDVQEYAGNSGPEIAYKLILRAKRDMFEADLWAHVASLAGDPDFLRRFAGGGAKAYDDSLEYWTGYASRLLEERALLAGSTGPR
jgi:hypothetical protein